IKGDYNTVMETGLINLETALQSIVKVRSEQPETKLARVKAITEKLILVAGEKRTKIENQLKITRQKQQQQITIKNKAATLIKQGLQHSISEFENWLDLSHLLKIERAKLAIAIETNDFKNWKVEFNKIVSNYQQSVTEWLSRSRDFFDVELSLELAINFPEPPYVETAQTETNNDTSELSAIEEIEKRFNQTVKAFLAINKRELFNNLADKIPFESESKPQKSLYAEAAEVYLTSFSQKALISLKEYQERAEKLIKEQPQPTQPTINREEYQLQLLDSAIENLRSSKLNSFKL
ncbi:MAG: hypothetical protein ACRC1Z_22105, partial [Waterburya sp.]